MSYPDPHQDWAGRYAPKPVTQRPVDIDTACWLWLGSLPLMVISYVAASVGQWQQDLKVQASAPLWAVYVSCGFITAVVGPLVVAGVFLMRSGYRLARTLLTGGAVGSGVFTLSRLFDLDGTAAVVHALSGITGVVLIGGGLYLVHRQDASKYLSR